MNPTDNKEKSGTNTYMFNVDILVEGKTNAIALEQLLHILNQASFRDFRIVSGLQMGSLIAQHEQQGSICQIVIPDPARASGGTTVPGTKIEPDSSADSAAAMAKQIQGLIAENRLIRLSVNKGHGVKLNIPCRVIQFDENTQTITVYHVDEKQVYAFTWNEIDDFVI
ncbi:hypothetical protein [Paenibacillus sp. GCM10027626]|uniref:hypothetical protein n=1 Tax=Paenibacillus sp. GCM10027626 TaxID=3273411 RepID=UPI00363D912D